MSSIEIRKVVNKEELNAAFDVRREVYILEQGIREEEEFDEYDKDCTHFIALIENEIGGTARWRMTEEGAKLERFAVSKKFRRRGVASALVSNVIIDVRSKASFIYLYAQINVLGLYKKFDFVEDGVEFEECGITHLKMIRKLD